MLAQIITENGQKKVIPLTADAGAGLPVGFIASAYKKGNYSGWLYLDGRDTTGTSEELSTHYPLLYAFLGSNKLPDYREFALVGAEENTTDVYNASTNPTGTIHSHDVYTEGQAKDDQLQTHSHNTYVNGDTDHPFKVANGYVGRDASGWGFDGSTFNLVAMGARSGRMGTTTRGKRKAVYFYIKATSGLSENAQDNVVAQLNEERSYSTSEVNTGKKWIDGKPIYRKVFTTTEDITNSTSSWGGLQTAISNLNLARCIYVDVAASGGGNFPIQFSATSGFRTYGTAVASAGVNIIFEYTKTT